MEFESDFIRENKAFKYPSILCENYQKPSMRCDLITIDQTSSPKSNYYLQNFHHLDHDHHHFHSHHDGSSSNPNFSSQTASFNEPFKAYTHTGDSANLGFSGQSVANNFQNSGEQYLTLPCRNPNIDMININGSDWSFLPLNCQDIMAKPMSFVNPNQEPLSCITAENGYYKKVVVMNKNKRTCLAKKKTYKSQKIKTTPVKGQWKGEEDRLLIQLVDQYGLRKWSHIAQMLPGRIGKQCRERWHNHLRPNIKKDTWSEEEDKVLIEAHVEIGNKWAEIAKRLPGRTENSIKNHWNATKRRQYSKRKWRSVKCPRGSLLQDYIKSLKLDSSSKSTRQCQRKSTTISHVANNINVNGNNVTANPQPIDRDDDHRLVDQDDGHDFGDGSDFCFGNCLIFQEDHGTVDSLFDDIVGCAAINCADDGHGKEELMVDLPAEDNNVDSVILEENYDDQVVMKKELDLVEMISQVNKIS